MRFFQPQKYVAWLLLGLLILLYLGLSLYQLDLPGLHYDEAFEAVPALQLLQGRPVATFRNHGLTLAGQTFPLMTQDYIGALNTYLVIPFIAFLGPTPRALRLMSVIAGALTLILAYTLTNQLSRSRWVGLTTVLLLAVDPTFVFWNRQGIFVTAITATIGLGASLCWALYLERQRLRWALAGAFLFGLGIYAKLLFVWLIVALIGAVILLNLPQMWSGLRHKKFGSVKQAGVLLLAFLVGCWPLIYYNGQTRGTLLSISQNAGVSYYGVDNLAFGVNLLERLRQFFVLTSGEHLWYLGEISRNALLPTLFFGVLVVLVVKMTTRKSNAFTPNHPFSPKRVALLPYLVIGLVIIASVGTVSALWVTHFALLMPWPAIALAIGGWFIYNNQTLLSPTAIKIILGGGLCLLAAVGILNTTRYHTALTESGGLSTHSDAIYDLSRWLDNHPNYTTAAMDWGLAAPITYLTAGRVVPVEVFGYTWESDTELTLRLETLIAQPGTLYLWRAPAETIFDRSEQFKMLYRPHNLEENIEEAFYERSGRPLLGITRLVERGSAPNPPK